MQLPQIAPLTVPAVVRAMAEIGVEHNPLDVRSLLIDADGLTLEVIARTADDAFALFGDEIATHTIRVPWAPAVPAWQAFDPGTPGRCGACSLNVADLRDHVRTEHVDG